MKNKSVECRRSRIFCILFLAMLCESVYAIEPGFIQNKIINTGKNSLGKSSRYFLTRDKVYWFTSDEWNPKTKELKIIATNILTNLSDTMKTKIPDMITISDLPDIAISGNYMVLIDDYNYNQHRFIRDKGEYRFLNRINSVKGCPVNKIESLGNNRFLFSCLYNFTPDQNNHNTNLAIYDAKANRLSKFIHPPLPCIAFSHLEQHWMATNSSTIALAMPCDYKILLYDTNLILKDSITGIPGPWKNFENHKIPFTTDPSKIHPKLLIDKLLNIEDSVSRIEGIYFIDDSLMMVSSLNMNHGKKQIDLWNINSKHLQSSVQSISEFPDYDTIKAARPLSLLTSEFSSELFQRKIISFSNEDFNLINNITYDKFKKLKDEYYENHDPQFSIHVDDFIIPGR